ncbi:probable inactive leucine-rich repeat receptor kinase XIAO isoform X2 [Triticum dicoccoides]|uniref:probable inactive leucine-rich repeat receptor kinase XIAO isoform X2 n=1 Tax=Triticum dicoccoides TaxID=85692 RepID=UPI00189130E0|nr:probable inactive leucine-rich repeat receptor kinase XIAO isoform X2 [Triticum dicoccoides]
MHSSQPPPASRPRFSQSCRQRPRATTRSSSPTRSSRHLPPHPRALPSAPPLLPAHAHPRLLLLFLIEEGEESERGGMVASEGSTITGAASSRSTTTSSATATAGVNNLDLKGIGLAGALPPTFSSLNALQDLSLQTNALSGPLPSFHGMAALRHAYLNDNAFSSLPKDFFDGLDSLEEICLDNNPLLPIHLCCSSSTSASTPPLVFFFYLCCSSFPHHISRGRVQAQSIHLISLRGEGDQAMERKAPANRGRCRSTS